MALKWSDIRNLQQHMGLDEVFTYMAVKHVESQLGHPPRKVDVVKVAGTKVGVVLGKMKKKGWFPNYEAQNRRYDLSQLDGILRSGQAPPAPSRSPEEQARHREAALRRLIAQKNAKALVEALRDRLIDSGCDTSVFTFRWMLHERKLTTSYLLQNVPVDKLQKCIDWVFTDPAASYLLPHCTSMRKVMEYLPKYLIRGKKNNAPGQGFIGDTSKHDEIWEGQG